MEDIVVPDSQVENDIATIRMQIQSLRQRRSQLSGLLLSLPRTGECLQRAKARSAVPAPSLDHALRLLDKQTKQNLENTYRICAGVTAFQVKDPDPHAVDEGCVLGTRIEVCVDGKYITPYYILLNRPHPASNALRIHKHTIPPSIPLSSLAARCLPQPDPGTAGSSDTAAQNLHRLLREVRRELVSRHLRLHAIAKLRQEAGLKSEANPESLEFPQTLEEEGSEELQPSTARDVRREQGKGAIADIRADFEGRDVRISFSDGRIARLKLARNGKIEKAVVRELGDEHKGERDWATEKKIMAANARIEGLVQRLLGKEAEINGEHSEDDLS